MSDANEHSDIFAWLSGIEETSPIQCLKRKQSSSPDNNPEGRYPQLSVSLPPTPISSVSRPTVTMAPQEPGEDPTSRPPSVSQYSSRTPTLSNGTPRKQLRDLSLASNGFTVRPMDPTNPEMPGKLRDFLERLIQPSDCGVGVISEARKTEIANRASDVGGAGFLPSPVAYVPAAVRDKLGRTPSFEQALNIKEYANSCESKDSEEAAWNMLVHSSLLILALHGGAPKDSALDVLVDFQPCTSATVISDYLKTSPGKKVDFCISLDAQEPAIAKAINDRRMNLPEKSINHTAHNPLINQPIVVSIETKKANPNNPVNAILQCGIWHMAQWRILRQLVSPTALDSIYFLPLLIVRGHDWCFAATSCVQDQTVLWAERPFGTTRDILGVYKVVYVIQMLAQWARDTYWPWFKEHALLLNG